MAALSSWAIGVLSSSYALMMLGCFGMIGLVELIRPARRAPLRHVGFNLAYAVVNLLAIAALYPTIALATARLVRTMGGGLIDIGGLVGSGIIGSLLGLLLSTAIADFLGYWLHRLQHRSRILWQQHLLHHSDEYLNVTSTSRQHLLEDTVMDPIFVALPMALLFDFPPVTIVWLSLLPYIWLHVVHANVRLGFGSLWWLVASPQFHRIHHSLEPQHIDRNFVSWFPVWDILFGTAYRPQVGEFPATGVAGVRVASLFAAYLLPFKGWAGMLSARFRRGVAIRT